MRTKTKNKIAAVEKLVANGSTLSEALRSTGVSHGSWYYYVNTKKAQSNNFNANDDWRDDIAEAVLTSGANTATKLAMIKTIYATT